MESVESGFFKGFEVSYLDDGDRNNENGELMSISCTSCRDVDRWNADDDPDFIECINSFLTNNDYEVLQATAGAEALDKIMKKKIDVLILDSRMPILNGLEVYWELKRLGRAVQ